MKTIKTSEATPRQIDWLVAKCEGVALVNGAIFDQVLYEPSENWAIGGPIIEWEGIEICPIGNGEWRGQLDLAGDWIRFYGDTPLIAAMRCYVAIKLGDEVEIPKELT